MNIRSALRKTCRELGSSGSYTYDDVIKRLRTEHPDLISRDSAKLEDMALKRMLSDVEARRTKATDIRQLEMFPELVGLPESCDARLVGLTEQRGVRVPFQDLPIKCLRMLANRPAQIKNNVLFKARLNQQIEALDPFIESEDEPISEVLKRSRKAETSANFIRNGTDYSFENKAGRP